MIYTAPCIMFWMRAYPLLGQVGGCWVLEFSSYSNLLRAKGGSSLYKYESGLKTESHLDSTNKNKEVHTV